MAREGAGLLLRGGLLAFFLKKKLPDGRSLVSSLRRNAPSLAVEEGASVESGGVGVVGVSVGVVSGGECSLMKLRPYFSLCR